MERFESEDENWSHHLLGQTAHTALVFSTIAFISADWRYARFGCDPWAVGRWHRRRAGRWRRGEEVWMEPAATQAGIPSVHTESVG
jgi:hypothetical protein